MEIDKSEVFEILTQVVDDGIVKEKHKGYNFHCCICGDSEKDKRKRRGWVLYEHKGIKFLYFCHNCGASMSIKKFLSEYHPNLHEKYFAQTLSGIKKSFSRKESLSDVGAKLITKTDDVVNISDTILPYSFNILDKNVTGITKKQLQIHALERVLERKIPREVYKDFLVCYDKKFENRWIIPYYDDQGRMYCYQGRSIYDVQPKYLTYNDENVKIYGYYIANPEDVVYITEGPIDSVFLMNAIATSGTISTKSEQFSMIKKKFTKRLWIFDNDKAGLKQTVKFASAGERVVLWPRSIDGNEMKDINDMVLMEKNTPMKATLERIDNIIQSNAYSGFAAITMLKLLKRR